MGGLGTRVWEQEEKGVIRKAVWGRVGSRVIGE